MSHNGTVTGVDYIADYNEAQAAPPLAPSVHLPGERFFVEHTFGDVRIRDAHTGAYATFDKGQQDWAQQAAAWQSRQVELVRVKERYRQAAINLECVQRWLRAVWSLQKEAEGNEPLVKAYSVVLSTLRDQEVRAEQEQKAAGLEFRLVVGE